MFDISVLKDLKLSELQEIAKKAKTIKINGVKKDTLISLILEHQALSIEPAQEKKSVEEKPKRTRITAEKKVATPENTAPLLFENEESKENAKVPETVTVSEKKGKEIATNEVTVKEEVVAPKKEKVVKFSKSAYEKKMALQKEKEALKE